MIQLHRPNLNQATVTGLSNYQTAVDAHATFPERVAFGKLDFPAKNVIGNVVFDEVKRNLVLMCNGAERCHYCEDSSVDEVEHFFPKDVYPDKCYDWNNFFYICGPCNNRKNNKCGVINGMGKVSNNTPPRRRRGQPPIVPTPPLSGVFAFVNIVLEDPLEFFILDIFNDTFAIVENPNKNGSDYERAKFTLECFGFGEKSVLRKARRNAYHNFLNALDSYHAESTKVVPNIQKLQRIELSIKQSNHQTVWQEMKRQRHWIPEINTAFNQASIALTW